MNCFNLGFLAGPLRAAPATEFRFYVLKKLRGFAMADLGSGRVSPNANCKAGRANLMVSLILFGWC